MLNWLSINKKIPGLMNRELLSKNGNGYYLFKNLPVKILLEKLSAIIK